MSDKTTPPSEDEVIKALRDVSTPLPPAIIADLELAISLWDCEDWSADVGHAIIARLRATPG